MTSEIREINSLISSAGTFCLNEDDAFTHANLFMGDESNVLKSDADGAWLVRTYPRAHRKLIRAPASALQSSFSSLSPSDKV